MKPKMIRTVILTLVILSVNLARGAGEPPKAALRLMPMPKSIELRRGRLSIDGSFSVSLRGAQDSRVTASTVRMLRHLQRKTGIPFSTFPVAAESATLVIHCGGAGERIQPAAENESYTLEVTERGALLTAPLPAGVLRGLETFLQLVELDDRSFNIPAIRIFDEPRFSWRGLLIDVSRHWEPVDVILRNLDAMAAVKMNVLHWHLSDDQGFRVESLAFPKLHQAGSEGHYYTQSEVRAIVAYARDRGIRVIPEFDMPGHTTAILVAYPELASAPGPYQIERSWGVFAPTMDPTSRKVYAFLNTFIGEMASLFPDEYFHIGGDEVSGKQWNANPKIQAFKARHRLKDNAALQAYFNRRLQKILAKHDKKMIGWDEVLHPDLPQSVMIQSWRGHAYLARGARQGYPGVLSHGLYLDAMRPASFHYAVDPLDKDVAALSDAEKSHILGGEACMWAEFVTAENIESRIWPRAAAIAERLWSPPSVHDVRDMYRRLEFMGRELESLGLRHRANTGAMLRRMAGSGDDAPLKMFAELFIPTSLSVRRKIQKYSSLTPLNRMVDAILPESDAARQFAERVDDAIADPAAEPQTHAAMRAQLSIWRNNADALTPMLDQSFLLQELIPAANMVVRLSVKGLEALNCLETKQPPTEAWVAESALLLELAEKPHAEMILTLTSPIRRLIEAANALH